MDFGFTEEQRALQDKVNGLGRQLLPLAPKADESDDVDWEVVRICAEEGLYQYVIPKEHGGVGIAATNVCIIREGLSRVCVQADTTFAMQGIGTHPIVLAGSEVQKQRYLPPVARGELLSTFALTEPEAGSDVAALSARAVRDGDDYVLNGRKRFISNGGAAGLYSVFVKTDPEKGAKGISAFIVEKGHPGFDDSRKLSLLLPHCIGEPVFTDCRLPKENLIGQEGQGMNLALGTLNVFRTSVGAAAVGMGQAAMEQAIAYAQRRHAFGGPLADQQAIQFKLADMAMNLDAARLLVYRAAWLRDQGGTPVAEASMAKLFATEAAQQAADEALQIHGGIGLVKGMLTERLYRGVRALRIYEGASEIQRLTIARMILKRSAAPSYAGQEQIRGEPSVR